MLINSGLSNNFSAKIMEIANYFYNRFFIKSKSYSKFIFKKLQTNTSQNFSYIQIFGNFMLANILDKKKSKFDYQII